MVAEHPKKPGRYVLAIECDGATYHASNTARDRDRLRQHLLEALGWRFHRIWSTDWFMRKSEEVDRAVKAFEAAVQYADELDSAQPAAHGVNHHSSDNGHSDAAVQPQRSNGRSAKPFFIPGQPINTYSRRQLIDVLRWVSSDGLMRTDEELLKETVDALGYRRRGARIDAVLTEAIQDWKRTAKGT
jgi:hypothetical protein